MKDSLSRRLAAEFIGTAFLVTAVVGSGIMAERLSGGNLGLALLANAIATGAALVALILAFGPMSGAHLNPVVSFADAFEHGLPFREAAAYAATQVAGGILGTLVAHLMFGLSLFSLSHHARSGWPQIFSEFIATFGLLCVIWGCSRSRSNAAAFAVGSYITGAYWFTSSTSFANPGVTIARSLTDTFSGIRPSDVPAFILAQIAGAGVATVVFRWLVPNLSRGAKSVVAAELGVAE
jgi:glycerol uptake facilitator-like aquaporin